MFNKLYEYLRKFFKENYKFLIICCTILFAFFYEFPYVIYKSGGIINLENRIVIDKDYEEKGTLNMSYVTAMRGSATFILLSFVLPDWDLIPLKEITTDDDYDEVIEVGKEYLDEGIDNAIIAAFNESSYSVNIKKEINRVIYISEDAKTNIKIGDEIVKIDDQEINSFDELKEYVNTLSEGSKVTIEVINHDKSYQREATIYEDQDKTLKIGVAFSTTYDYETEIPVSIKMKNNESGSSGGLMMSLAIYNALTEEDITHGLKIVGTGSITASGEVEEISGVKYKVLGANKKKADIFFCPVENYEEAMNIKKKRNLDIKIVKVKTLKDAINYLENI